MKTLKVTIHNRQHIPFLNRIGPITFPIALSETMVNDLRLLGFDVRVVEEVLPTPVDESQFGLEADKAKLAEQPLEHPPVTTEQEVVDTAGYTNEDPLTQEEEIALLDKASLEKMEAGEIRDYLEQFTEVLTKSELDVVKNAHKKKLIELGVRLYEKVNTSK